MFQKHKINVGKKFQAEIPKFNIFSKKSSIIYKNCISLKIKVIPTTL